MAAQTPAASSQTRSVLEEMVVTAQKREQYVQFTIRGLTQNDLNDHTESPVAVYINDTFTAKRISGFRTFKVSEW